MRNRAERRHHHRRMIKRVSKFTWFNWMSPESKEKHIKQMAENRQICSCSACGNQRHNNWSSEEEKMTMRERRFREYADFHEKDLE